MAETLTKDGRITWLKEKYAVLKDKGRYKGGTSGGGSKTRKRRKIGGGPSPIEYVKVITGEGRVTWLTRPRETRR